jgi:hypothetical protein
MLSEPHPDQLLPGSFMAAFRKVDGGYLGDLVGVRSGRSEWTCRHDPHPSREKAKECSRAEIRARRGQVQPHSWR